VTVLITVAQCGSLSAAAGKLGLSKSTVSAQLVRLERRIGARRLQRSPRAVILTEADRAYLCQAVVDELSAGRLVRLLPDWQVVDIPVLAVYPDNRQIAARVRTFIDHIARRLKRDSLVAPAA